MNSRPSGHYPTGPPPWVGSGSGSESYREQTIRPMTNAITRQDRIVALMRVVVYLLLFAMLIVLSIVPAHL